LSRSRNKAVQPQKRILCFAREAGGAEAIAPVIKNLKNRYTVLLLAKDFAILIFQRHNLEYQEYATHSDEALLMLLARFWEGLMPDVVLTSATSLPWNDMTERQLWLWAGEHAIPSMGVIDQWQNYGLRFSGCNPDEFLAYLPTRITALDERAREEMISEGIPAELIAVTGQPALDVLFKERQAFASSDRKAIRNKVGVETDSFLVLFVSEVMKRDFADSLGYTEESTLAFLIRTLSALIDETGMKLHLVVKLHPQNTTADFAGIDFNQARQMFPISIDNPPNLTIEDKETIFWGIQQIKRTHDIYPKEMSFWVKYAPYVLLGLTVALCFMIIFFAMPHLSATAGSIATISAKLNEVAQTLTGYTPPAPGT